MAEPQDSVRAARPSVVAEDLVLRAARGDRDAQAVLLARYHYFIRRAVRARLGSGRRPRESTSDLEQDVALEVLRSLAGRAWRGRGALAAWLRRLATHEVIDESRYRAAWHRDPRREVVVGARRGREAARSTGPRIDEQRRLHELEGLLDELPDVQAEAMVLFYQGHSHGDIAEVLGVTPEAARKHVARGRANLAMLARR